MRRPDIVNRIRETLRQYVPEAECVLYGSEARGEARLDSDIDILILLPELKGTDQYIRRRSEISGILFELSMNLGVDISPLILPLKVWQSRKTPFTINVINEGIRI